MMKKIKAIITRLLALVLVLPGLLTLSAEEEPLQVVSSFSILTNIVEEIGGDLVEVHNLVPIGTDPHEYEPKPEDIKAATDADLLFYNGLNLEGGDDGWFMKMVESVHQDHDKIVEVAADIEPKYLNDEHGNEEVNPHAFIDPVIGITMAEVVRDELIEHLPDHEEEIQARAQDYLAELEAVDKKYQEKIAEIPEDRRVFMASEQAFQYMTDRYGLKEGFIWAIDTDENGSPQQITDAVAFIEENQPPVLFVESNVDRRPMETVSKESGVEIYEKPIFSDEIGQPGEDGDSYVKFLEYNLDVIYNGLK